MLARAAVSGWRWRGPWSTPRTSCCSTSRRPGSTGVGVERLEAVVREEAARGVTVLVVTHDERFASALDAQLVRMEAGRIAAPTAS